MKFSDGFWLVQEGFDIQHARQVRDVEVTEHEVSVLAATRVVTTRGDTLNNPTATVTLSSPADGVIRVRIEHHAGNRHPGPDFALPGAGEIRPEIERTPAQVSLTSGGLAAVVHRDGPWRLEIGRAHV